jgi:hypothetical protein
MVLLPVMDAAACSFVPKAWVARKNSDQEGRNGEINGCKWGRRNEKRCESSASTNGETKTERGYPENQVFFFFVVVVVYSPSIASQRCYSSTPCPHHQGSASFSLSCLMSVKPHRLTSHHLSRSRYSSGLAHMIRPSRILSSPLSILSTPFISGTGISAPPTIKVTPPVAGAATAGSGGVYSGHSCVSYAE